MKIYNAVVNGTNKYYCLDKDGIEISNLQYTIEKENKAYIELIYTDENFRKKGYATNLIKHFLEQISKEKDIKETYLMVKSFEYSLIKFYTSFGFFKYNELDEYIYMVKKNNIV